MAYAKKRQESLPTKSGGVFKVGDGAHHGYNGDRYPLTVVRISDSGREIQCSRDQYKIVDNLGGYVEGDRKCEFTTVEVHEDQLITFKLDRSGFWFRDSGKWILTAGRCYACNPCF
jgi:hypothetical protein